MAFKPDYLTIEDTCEVLGCKTRHVLDLVSSGTLCPGVFARDWYGWVIPQTPGGWPSPDWDSKVLSVHPHDERLSTFQFTSKKTGDTQTVSGCTTAGFWFLGPVEAGRLASAPKGGVKVGVLLEASPARLPSPEDVFLLMPRQDVSRWIAIEDIRFLRTDVEDLMAEATDECSVDAALPMSASEPRVYWRVVLLDNLPTLLKDPSHGFVTRAIRHLKSLNDPRIPNEGGVDVLFWIDRHGTKKSVSSEIVSSAISDLKKLLKPPR